MDLLTSSQSYLVLRGEGTLGDEDGGVLSEDGGEAEILSGAITGQLIKIREL